MLEDWLKYLTAAAKVFVVAVLLGESFAGIDRLLVKTGFGSGLFAFIAGPAIIHLLIVIAALMLLGQPKLNLPKKNAVPWLAAAGPAWIAMAASGAFLTSILFPEPNPAPGAWPNLPWWISSVFLAPVLEELVYRGLISPVFRRTCGNLMGSYFAAVLFAWVHSRPTLAGIFAGHPGGVPPGPFLLALAADWLYLKSGSIWVAVAFHVACNVTPVLFNGIDPRWLSWLGMLYQWGT
jgi:membrane protease YdiL (CAAX protease family)